MFTLSICQTCFCLYYFVIMVNSYCFTLCSIVFGVVQITHFTETCFVIWTVIWDAAVAEVDFPSGRVTGEQVVY